MFILAKTSVAVSTFLPFSARLRSYVSVPLLVILLVGLGVWALSGCSSSPSDSSQTTQTTPSEAQASSPATATKTILFFGNSLTAGYGLDLDEAFPALIQQRLDSLGISYRVINAGVSGETTATGNSRIDWVVKQQPIDIFVLELGGNDGLRGIAVAETRKNLQEILDKVKAKYPDAKLVLAGMQVPPNMGVTYSNEFKRIYADLAAQNPHVTLIPFLLEGVGGEPSLNLPDGIHPTAEGHRIVAETVWTILKPLV